MKKKLTTYIETIDTLITNTPAGTDWKGISQTHLIQIQFFQHERLVHLLVTILFALLTFSSIWIVYFAFSVAALLLTLLLLCLLIPYIRHYYLLENGVQKLYEQYDRLCELGNTQND